MYIAVALHAARETTDPWSCARAWLQRQLAQ